MEIMNLDATLKMILGLSIKSHEEMIIDFNPGLYHVLDVEELEQICFAFSSMFELDGMEPGNDYIDFLLGLLKIQELRDKHPEQFKDFKLNCSLVLKFIGMLFLELVEGPVKIGTWKDLPYSEYVIPFKDDKFMSIDFDKILSHCSN